MHHPSRQPRVFISYSWDSEEHKAWVRKLAEELRRNGVDCRLDQWFVHPGVSFTHFMEEEVEHANFVVAVCTPTFAAKCNAREGGVGYEQQIVSGKLATGSRGKALPVLRRGSHREGDEHAIPALYRGIAVVDFRDDNAFERKLEELLRVIFSSPRFAPPPIGVPPGFAVRTGEALAGEPDRFAVPGIPAPAPAASGPPASGPGAASDASAREAVRPAAEDSLAGERLPGSLRIELNEALEPRGGVPFLELVLDECVETFRHLADPLVEVKIAPLEELRARDDRLEAQQDASFEQREERYRLRRQARAFLAFGQPLDTVLTRLVRLSIRNYAPGENRFLATTEELAECVAAAIRLFAPARESYRGTRFQLFRDDEDWSAAIELTPGEAKLLRTRVDAADVGWLTAAWGLALTDLPRATIIRKALPALMHEFLRLSYTGGGPAPDEAAFFTLGKWRAAIG